MKQRKRWVFLLDKDQIFRLSLRRILNKYGFEAEEIGDLAQLERRKKDLESGMIFADLEIETLEEISPSLKNGPTGLFS